MAVDALGDVFIADTYNNRVVEVPAGGGAQRTVGTGLSAPDGGAVAPAPATTTTTTTGPAAALPEAPYAALLALGALPAGGYVLLRRRRSS